MAAAQALEDVFGEDTEDIAHDNQWNTLKDARHNEGYREGITDSKESALQLGFNKGFKVGFSYVQLISRLRGALWAIIVTFDSRRIDLHEPEKSQAKQQLYDIMRELTSFELKMIEDVHNRRGIDGTSKSMLTIDEASQLVDEQVNLARLKRQDELTEKMKLSIDILRRLKLDDSSISSLME